MDAILDRETITSWYVSRYVELPAGGSGDLLRPGALIVAPDGSTLQVVSPGIVEPGPIEAVNYRAVLSSGHWLGRTSVELLVSPFAPDRAEIGMRPAGNRPGWTVSARRYFSSAWSVLDEVADELVNSSAVRHSAA